MDYMGPIAVGKSMGSTLTGVLEQEDPGTIEQLFRFISRPAYALRSAITGDLEGTIRNTLQFMNEIPTGGMVDPDLTVTSLVDTFFEALGADPGLPADLTSKAQRPEMSDVIYRWGGPHPASLGWGSRMALDVVAGALTDPTNLISGGGKGVAQGALTGATRSMAQDLAVAGLRSTKLGTEALEATMHLPGPLGLGGLKAAKVISPERLAPMARGLEGKAAEKLLFQNIDPSTGLLRKWSTNTFSGSLADSDAVAGNFVRGELPLLVTDRNLPNRLAARDSHTQEVIEMLEAKFRDNLVIRGQYEQQLAHLRAQDPAAYNAVDPELLNIPGFEPQNLARDIESAEDMLSRSLETSTANIADRARLAAARADLGVNAELARGIAAQEILQGELPVIGNNMGGSTVYYTPRSEWRFHKMQRLMSQGPLDSTPIAQMAHERDLLRLRGMSEEGIASHLGQQWPDLGMDGTVARLLSEDAQWGRLGVEVPGETIDHGIRALRDKYGMEDPAALYASFFGRRGQAIPNFWSNAASVTVPGMIYNRMPQAARETVQGWTTGVRRLFNKFDPGDLPPAAQKVLRVLSGQQRANNIKHNDVAGAKFFGRYTDDQLEMMGKERDAAWEEYHSLLREADDLPPPGPRPDPADGQNFDSEADQAEAFDGDDDPLTPGEIQGATAFVPNRPGIRNIHGPEGAWAAETPFMSHNTPAGERGAAVVRNRRAAQIEAEARQRLVREKIEELSNLTSELGERSDRAQEGLNALQAQAEEIGNPGGMQAPELPPLARADMLNHQEFGGGLAIPGGQIDQFGEGLPGLVPRLLTLSNDLGHLEGGYGRLMDDMTREAKQIIGNPQEYAEAAGLTRQEWLEGIEYDRAMREWRLAQEMPWHQAEALGLSQSPPPMPGWRAMSIHTRLDQRRAMQSAMKGMQNELERLLPRLNEMVTPENGESPVGLIEELITKLRAFAYEGSSLESQIIQAERKLDALWPELHSAQNDITRAGQYTNTAMFADPQHHRVIAASVMQRLIDRVAGRIATDRGVPVGDVWHEVEDTFKAFDQGMEEIPPAMAFRLKEEGQTLWNNAKGDPFYLPHQAEERIWELLNEGALDRTAAREIRDVFARRREYPTSSAFQSALRGLADQYHIPLNSLDELQKWNLGELYLRRMHAFERTKFRAQAMEYGERMAAAHDIPSRRFATYVRGLFAPAGTRTGTVEKLLGGGVFEVRRPTEGSALHRLLGNGDPNNPLLKITEGTNAGGQHIWRMQWAGLNRIYKPLLTSFPTNPKFHFRNAMSAVVMGAMDPDIGWSGARQTWDLVRNGYIVRKFLKLDYTPDEVTEAVRFLTDPNPIVRHGALSRLRDSGRMVGNYTWDETARILHRSLGGRNLGQADMLSKLDDGFMQGYRLAEEAAGGNPQIANGALRWFQNLVDLGQNMANQVEHRFRTAATLELLSKGVPANEVVERVQRAFVDYDLNSTTERWIRDVFPFAKFMIGSSAWLKPMIERPQMLTALARARNSGARSLENEPGGGAFLPERAEGSVALPLPWRDKEGNLQFLIGLGLPQESALAVLNAATSTEGFRKTVGGALHPVLRLPTEAVLGRSMFFDEEFGAYRRASPLTRLLPGAKEVPSANGTTRTEIPGAWNEILNASPLAVQENNLNKVLDERWGPITKALNVLTGIRTLSVDMKRELRERMAEYLKDKVTSGQVGELSVFFNRMNPEDTPEDLKVVLREFAAQRSKPKP